MARIGGLVSFLLASLWAYRWEPARAYLYERGFSVMSSVEADTVLHWGVPLLLAGLGIFLFLKTGDGDLANLVDIKLPSGLGRVPFHDAARHVYEAAEKAGVVDLMISPTLTADAKLNHLKMMLMVDDEVEFHGVQPPSTKPQSISKDELQGHDLYPAEGEVSQLNNLIPIDHPPAYVNVTVTKSSLRRVTQKYLTEYVAEARELSKH